jgi:enterochelin esterase family protein
VNDLIRRLKHREHVPAHELHGFLDHNEMPWVEGSQVTFFFRGHVDMVRLRHWIFGLPSSQPFHHIPHTDVWMLTIDIPYDSRVEYKLEVTRHGQSRWIRDPRNSRLAYDPFGANSVCYGAGYQTPAWTQFDEEARQGEIEHHELAHTAFGSPRHVSVYKPARFRDNRRYPIIIAHDGGDYVKYANLKVILDNLIHYGEIAPMIVALTHPHDRIQEYPGNEAHTTFIAKEVLPYMEHRFPLFDKPRSRGLMGASFGGVATLATAWRHQGLFGRLLLQSGSFAFTDIGDEHRRGPAFDPVVQLINAFREHPGKPSNKVYMSCGMYESLIYENRSLLPLLQETGMDVLYEEVRDGHNWINWRDRLRKALCYLFPGPLWMYYE